MSETASKILQDRENASQTIDAPQNENEHEKAGDDN